MPMCKCASHRTAGHAPNSCAQGAAIEDTYLRQELYYVGMVTVMMSAMLVEFSGYAAASVDTPLKNAMQMGCVTYCKHSRWQ